MGQIFNIEYDSKTGQEIITCQCGQQSKITPNLRKCPFCSIDLPTHPEYFEGRFYPFIGRRNQPQVKYNSKEITKWLQVVSKKGNLDWKAEETKNILLAGLQEKDSEIRLQAFLVLKKMPIKLQLLARFKWKVIEALENKVPAFKLVALEIIQKWPYKQKRHPRIQERLGALQTDENPGVRHLSENLSESPSKMRKIIEEIREIFTLRRLLWSVGMNILFLLILLEIENVMRRGNIIEFYLVLIGVLMFVTWLIASYSWLQERYYIKK